MSRQTSMIHRAANEQSKPIELSEQQLDNVAGGTKASHSLFEKCCTGKHIPNAVIELG